jgi:hypothetical protein
MLLSNTRSVRALPTYQWKKRSNSRCRFEQSPAPGARTGPRLGANPLPVAPVFCALDGPDYLTSYGKCIIKPLLLARFGSDDEGISDG